MSAKAALSSRQLRIIAAHGAAHLLASVVYFGVFASFFANDRLIELVKIGVGDPQMQSDVVTPLLLVFGLSACAWALTFIVISLVRGHLGQRTRTVISKPRGTIITETLVVLPIFFLLTFGLAQMAINSIAGLLTTLASYEVARTLSVWAPEEGNRANRSQIRQKARLVAAGVLAPVVPTLRSGLCADEGAFLPAMRAGLTSVGMNGAATGEARIWNMAEGFDKATFADRGPTKLTLAYCNIEVTWAGPASTSTDDTRIYAFTSRVRYHHPAVFPLIGPIFTKDYGAGEWITPYVSTFDKEYSLSTYLTPNIHRPYSDPNYWFNDVP